MSIFSIWESQFPAESAAEGLDLTQAIWQDMPSYEGYLHHEVFVDDDDPGHLLVVSEWAGRERADAVLREYADQPKAQAVNRLVSQPRRRFAAHRLASGLE